MASTAEILQQIDRALDLYEETRAQSNFNDLSDNPGGPAKFAEVKAIVLATLERLAPPNSAYLRDRNAILVYHVGALRALRSDYAAGYLDTIHGLVRAEVFADFLEMAAYLLEQGYKDPAAVLAGGVLEEHLRAMCNARSIPVEVSGRAKKADAMNNELYGAEAYNALIHKQVTAWLGLRNNAAHGKYGEYTGPHVDLMLQGVRGFVSTNS